MRLGKLKLMIPDCPHCGYPVMVDDFAAKIDCESCHHPIPIASDAWREIFEALFDHTETGDDAPDTSFSLRVGGRFEIRVEAAVTGSVPCKKCKSPLEIPELTSQAPTASCHQCGHKHTLSPIPREAQSHKARFSLGTRLQDSDKVRKEVSPIAMTCPNCAATLRIGQDKERVTHCEYCNGEFLIPDPLWKRLHPIQTAQDWYVVFDAPPPPTPEQRTEKRRRQAQRDQKRREKERNRAAEERKVQNRLDVEEEIRSENSKFKGRVFWGYFAAMMTGIFLIGFPFIFIIPLAESLGSQFCNGEFSVSTSTSGDTTSYSYYCTDASGQRHSADIYGLIAIGLGVGITFSIRTLLIPIGYVKTRKRIKRLEGKFAQLE